MRIWRDGRDLGGPLRRAELHEANHAREAARNDASRLPDPLRKGRLFEDAWLERDQV
jgi:hypothetical protein